MLKIPAAPAIETASQDFTNSEDYGVTSYIKAASWVYLLDQTIGREKIDLAFHKFFSDWKFKHPQPADMKKSFEQAINGKLNNYFDLLNVKGSLLE